MGKALLCTDLGALQVGERQDRTQVPPPLLLLLEAAVHPAVNGVVYLGKVISREKLVSMTWKT